MIKKIIHTLGHSRPVQWVLHQSKTLKIPGFKDVSLFDTLVRFRQQILDDNIIERASAISYNFSMAIPPTIIFLFTLIPLFPISQSFLNETYGLIRSVIPGENNYTAIISFLEDFIKNPRNGLLSFGFLLSLFFSSNAIMGVMRSFDKDYPGFVKRKGLQKRWAAMKITLVLDFLFVMCITLIAAQGKVLDWIGIKNQFLKDLISYSRWLLIVLLIITIVSYIYRAVPSVNKKWSWITPGSILATILMLLIALGFSWWVGNFGNFNKLYGSIGTLLIIMIFIFLNSLILLIGFEINVSIRGIALKRDAYKEEPFAEDVLI